MFIGTTTEYQAWFQKTPELQTDRPQVQGGINTIGSVLKEMYWSALTE